MKECSFSYKYLITIKREAFPKFSTFNFQFSTQIVRHSSSGCFKIEHQKMLLKSGLVEFFKYSNSSSTSTRQR